MKPTGILWQAGYWEPRSFLHMAVIGSPFPSSLFLDVSRCLSFAGLWMGWNHSGYFVQFPKRLGKLVTHPPLLFWAKRNLLGWEFPFGTKQCQSWGRDDAGKMKLFFLSFLCGCSQIFALLCCWSFVSGLLSSELFSFVDSFLTVVLCGKTEAWVSYTAILVIKF